MENTNELGEAREKLRAEAIARGRSCMAEITAILQKYNCRIDYSITLTSEGQARTRWGAVPLPPREEGEGQ